MIICLLIPLGAASASDINNTADDQVLSATPNTDTVSASVNLEQENDTLSVQNDEKNILSAGPQSGNNILGTSENKGSFQELNNLILLTETNSYQLTKDYEYKGAGDDNTIKINMDNFILDANHHNINLAENTQTTNVITVNANNVTLKNLDIKNVITVPKYFLVYGDDFLLTDSTFNNVDISNRFFDAEGTNTKILNSKFSKCNGTAQLHGSYLIVKGCTFDSWVFGSQLLDIPNGGFLEVHDSTFNNISRLFVGVRCNPVFNNITVKNSVAIESGSYPGIISVKDNYFVVNSHFEGITAESSILSGGAQVKNTTFTNNTANYLIIPESGDGAYSGDTIDNCTIEKNNIKYITNHQYSYYDDQYEHRTRYYYFNAFIIKNSTFRDNNMSMTTWDRDNFIMYDNIFIDNNVTTANSMFSLGGDKKYVVNNTFINNYNFKLAPISITGGTTDDGRGHENGNNKFHGNINSTGQESGIYNTTSINNITLLTDVYVANESTGDKSGKNKSNRCNLTEAINSKILYGGNIYLEPGEYSELNGRQNLYANLIGETREGVILNRVCFYHYIYQNKITNITFNNTDGSFLYRVSNVYWTNCTINNYNKTNYLFATITPNNNNPSFEFAVGHKWTNITITNSDFTQLISYFNKYQTMSYQLENFTVKDSTVTGIFLRFGASSNNLVKHFNFTKCTFKNAVMNAADGYGNVNGFTMTFDDINFTDCNFINNPIIKCENSYVFADISNIRVVNYNVSTTVSCLVYLTNGHLTNFTLINEKLTNNISNLIQVGSKVSSVDGVKVENYENMTISNLITGGRNDFTSLTNVVLSNLNVSNIVNGNAPLKLKNINAENVNFTSGTILSIVSGSTLEDSAFVDYTGHLVINGSSINIINTNFENGDNPTLNGGAVLLNGSYVKFIHCNFTDNVALNGGAVYIYNISNRANFDNCNFNGNNASLTDGHGGALYIDYQKQFATDGLPMTLGGNSTKIIPNPDQLNGIYGDYSALRSGRIYIVLDPDNWGKFNDTGALISKSNKTGLDPDNAMDFVSALGLAGSNSELFFVNASEVYDFNTIMPSLMVDAIEIRESNMTIHGNVNTTIVGLRFNVCPEANDLTIKNMVFTGVTRDSVIIFNGTDGTLENSAFKDNGGNAVLLGGAIQIYGNHTIIKNTSFINNNVLTSDVGVGFGGALYINASYVDINNCTFDSNQARAAGSHIYIDKDNKYITIYNNTSFSNGKTGSVGGIYLQGDRITVEDSLFELNDATYGGAIYVVGGGYYNNILSSEFNNNTATSGGAVYLIHNGKFLTINENDFNNNTAFTSGGALFIDTIGDVESFIIDLNNYKNNTAITGGAVYVDNSGVTINGGLYQGNNATLNGGAVFVNQNNVVLNDMTFKDNNATLNGGAVFVNQNNVVLKEMLFENNSAVNGGGVYVNANPVSLINCNFTENRAVNGSCIYVAENQSVLFNNVYLYKNHVLNESQGYGDVYYYSSGSQSQGKGLILDPSVDEGGSSSYHQFECDNGFYWLDTAFVTFGPSKGQGRSFETATTWDDAFNGHIRNGALIVFVDEISNLNDIVLNITNYTIGIVGYTYDGKNRKIIGNDKYLFNQPKNAKNKKKLCKNISFQSIIYPPK